MRSPHRAVWFAILGILLLSGRAPATPPAPSNGTAVIDGAYAEWNLGLDFFTEMYRAGNTTKPVESRAYLRYDCGTRTLYVLVLVEPGVTGTFEPDESASSWVAIGAINNKLVNQYSGNDGTPPDFAWVEPGYDGEPSHVRGYEASLPLATGTTLIIIHQQVWDSGSQTSATPAFPQSGPTLTIECSLLGACCFLDGHCETLTETQCLASPEQAGWLGTGASCVPESPCTAPDPLAACCEPQGICTITTQDDCAAPNIWHPEYTSCSPNFCPPPLPARKTTWGNLKASYR